MADTETLLLIHNQQTQVFEFHALLQQLMGADNHIDGTAAHILQGFTLLPRGSEPTQHINTHRESAEARYRRLVVLLRQYGGGNENGRLLSIHDAFHHGAQGNLSFAEAHIAAQQPVHGGGRFHVVLDVCNAAQLVICFGVGKIVFKFPLPRGIRRKGKAGLPLAGSVELNQLTSHILGGLSRLGLCLLPGIGANLVQPNIGILSAATNILADQIQLCCRDIQGIRALIGNFNIVLNCSVHLDLLHCHEAADTVVFVYDQVTGNKIREGVQLLTVGCSGFLCLAPGLAFGNHLSFGKDGQFGHGVFHAIGQRAFTQEYLPRLWQRSQGDAQKGTHALFPQHLLEQLCPPPGAAKNHAAKFHLLVVFKVTDHRIHTAAVAG